MGPSGSGWMHGLVKSVPSGDSVLVIGSTTQAGPPPEKMITLASLIAPRLGRRDNSNKDEPFAFDSREFLRKKLIGRQVKFRIDYAVASIGREFGQVYVGDENVGLSVIAAGWAKCRNAGGEQASNYEDLARAEQDAQAGEIGMWTKDPAAIARAVRMVPENFNAQALLPAERGKPMPAIVEAVLNGSCLRVLLLTDSSETRYATVTVFLAGIQCPAMARKPAVDPNAAPDAPKPEAQPEPFAREAKHFTEVKLLNREVRVVLEGADKYQNLFCSVLYAEEGQPVDVAEQLSRNGLCKVVDWSAAMMAGGAAKLRAAERVAKDSRARLWKNYVAPPPSANSLRGNNFTAKIVEVVSGDVVVVADVNGGAERRVNLSSIRAPRMGNERRGQKADPWAAEAKEFLRQRCIGCTVKVSMEYSRKVGGAEGGGGGGGEGGGGGAGGGGERTLDFGSVMLPADKKAAAGEGGVDQLNVAEMLVLRGLASAGTPVHAHAHAHAHTHTRTHTRTHTTPFFLHATSGLLLTLSRLSRHAKPLTTDVCTRVCINHHRVYKPPTHPQP